jgi:hypothetical protein
MYIVAMSWRKIIHTVGVSDVPDSASYQAFTMGNNTSIVNRSVIVSKF